MNSTATLEIYCAKDQEQWPEKVLLKKPQI
jgi:hypothetical protein